MPHCYQPNDAHRIATAKPSRADAGLPEEGFVFCSFNQSYKFDAATFDIWCRLLREVPGSVLWLLRPPESAMARLLGIVDAHGVSPERVVFAARAEQQAHLGRLQLADLALDTFPVNSHTTASDALWSGVPLVTQMGASFAGRVAASLLTTLSLPELIADSSEGYYAIAKGLALDAARLARIRDVLNARRLDSPLFDTARFTRNLEALFVQMWAQNTQGIREIIALVEPGGATA